jgi:hypothetical protein
MTIPRLLTPRARRSTATARRALARALATAPTPATRQELLALQARG